MSAYTLVPLVVLTLLAYTIGALAGRLQPSTASRLLATVLAAVSLTTTVCISLLAAPLSFMLVPTVELPAPLAAFVRDHGSAPVWLTIASGGVLVMMLTAIAVFGFQGLRVRRAAPAGRGVIIVRDSHAVAFSMGGSQQRIVLSSGLLDVLDQEEVRVVLAHERSHLRHRHGLMAFTISMTGRLCPWLRPVCDRGCFVLERWADEDAAIDVGNRAIVASAIARAALAGEPPVHRTGFLNRAAEARVKAMLSAPPTPSNLREKVALASTTVATTGMAGSALQLHHAVHSALHTVH